MAFVNNTPGVNRQGAEFLAKNGAIMIGADNLILEQTEKVDSCRDRRPVWINSP